MIQRDITSILKARKLKTTPQRLAVHDAVRQLGHASAEMVLEHIAAEGKVSITTASVYNILSQFTELGILHKRPSLSGRIFYSPAEGTHAVLYDIRNDSFADVRDEEIVAAVETALKGRRFRGYRLERVDIQLICRPTRRIRIK